MCLSQTLDIDLYRVETLKDSVRGRLYFNGIYMVDTLEPPEDAEFPCIPPGVYSFRLYDSPRFRRKLLLIDVPGRKYIEVHVGNYVSHVSYRDGKPYLRLYSRGCILVGDYTKTDDNTGFLASSKRNLDRLSATYTNEFFVPGKFIVH